MGCSGCGKARAAMKAGLQAQKSVQPIAKSPVVPAVQKTPRQLRIEARAARIAARNVRMAARNAAFLAQKKVDNPPAKQ